MKPQYAIIVAGGKGTRFNSVLPNPDAVPKQFLLLNGMPVLMHTLQRFADYYTSQRLEPHIILVLPEAQISYWDKLCKQYDFGVPHTIATGGETRTLSVSNGLQHVPNNALVAIHDGVRPLLTTKLIERCFNEAEQTGCAIPTMPATDTLRLITGKLIDRNSILCVQTPQTFDSTMLKQAYQYALTALSDTIFTDDASVYEALGKKLSFVEGESNNIKITRPFDLAVAKLLIATSC